MFFALLAIILIVVEVCIALYVHDGFIRPYGGDFLVVILIYCTLMACFRLAKKTALWLVLLFAMCVEVLQCFPMKFMDGLPFEKFIRIVVGHSFSWWDVAMYVLGVGLCALIPVATNRKKRAEVPEHQ